MEGSSEGVMAVAEIVGSLMKAYDSQVPVNITKIKSEIARKYKLSFIPKMVDIIASVPDDYKDKLLPYIKAKPVRTASGVAVVAVMSKPHRCPHIAMTGNVCCYLQEDQIVTSNTRHKLTLGTSQRACERLELDTIHIVRREVE
jgi:elongator complex protein 3